MNAEKLIEQLETYANAITAFMVAQSLGLAVSLGTNASFACLAFSETRLNTGLKIHFMATLVLACLAMYFFYRSVRKLQTENLEIFRFLYIGRALAAALFVAIPVGVLHSYGAEGTSSQSCQKLQNK